MWDLSWAVTIPLVKAIRHSAFTCSRQICFAIKRVFVHRSHCGELVGWSRDDDHAFELARGVEAGTVFINVHQAGASDHTTPFGGVKQSGIGRSNGWASIQELTETQVLIRRDDAASLPGSALR